MGQTLDCLGKGIEFTHSHQPEEATPDSFDKCEFLDFAHYHWLDNIVRCCYAQRRSSLKFQFTVIQCHAVANS